jgi:hypothetical protein
MRKSYQKRVEQAKFAERATFYIVTQLNVEEFQLEVMELHCCTTPIVDNNNKMVDSSDDEILD